MERGAVEAELNDAKASVDVMRTRLEESRRAMQARDDEIFELRMLLTAREAGVSDPPPLAPAGVQVDEATALAPAVLGAPPSPAFAKASAAAAAEAKLMGRRAAGEVEPPTRRAAPMSDAIKHTAELMMHGLQNAIGSRLQGEYADGAEALVTLRAGSRAAAHVSSLQPPVIANCSIAGGSPAAGAKVRLSPYCRDASDAMDSFLDEDLGSGYNGGYSQVRQIVWLTCLRADGRWYGLVTWARKSCGVSATLRLCLGVRRCWMPSM